RFDLKYGLFFSFRLLYLNSSFRLFTMNSDRRKFIQNTSFIGLAMSSSHSFSFSQNRDKIIGQGDFQYKVDAKWGLLDPAKVPVNNCHEMVMERKGRMIMVTDEPKNNVIIYDQSGKFLSAWTLGMDRAHGLTLVDEGDAEY